MYFCRHSMEWMNCWLEWAQCFLIFHSPHCPPILLVSPRCHPHWGECDRGDEGSGTQEYGGVWAWCPTLQTAGAGRVLDQCCPRCLLGEAWFGTLQRGRGESTSNGETILARRYVHFLTIPGLKHVFFCVYLWSVCIGYCHLVYMYLLLHMTIITLGLPCERHDVPPHTCSIHHQN